MIIWILWNQLWFCTQQPGFQTEYFNNNLYNDDNTYFYISRHDFKECILHTHILLFYVLSHLDQQKTLLLKHPARSLTLNAVTLWYHTTSPCHKFASFMAGFRIIWFSTAPLLLFVVLGQVRVSWPMREDLIFGMGCLKETGAKTASETESAPVLDRERKKQCVFWALKHENLFQL